MADETTPAAAPAAGPILVRGPETSEFAAMQNSAWWGKAMIIIGVLSTTLSGVVEGIHEYQQTVPTTPGAPVPGASQLAFILMVSGIALSVIGGIKKALGENAYITGRSIVKSAALRDAPVAPPQV